MKIANIGGARAVLIEYKNQEHYLLFNGLAMFALHDAFGSDFVDKMAEKSEEGLRTLIQIAAILAEHGELARRAAGFESRATWETSDWGTAIAMTPIDMLTLRNGCMDAISLGYGREVTNEDEEVDLGLAELQKKSL